MHIEIVHDKVLSKVSEFVGFVGLNSELKVIRRKVIWYLVTHGILVQCCVESAYDKTWM